MASLNNFKLFGTSISISSGFLLLLSWLHFIDRDNLLFFALLACFLHELGHYFAIIACGGTVEQVEFSVTGGNMSLPSGLSYKKELLCALSGPAVNLLVGTLCSSLQILDNFVVFHYLLAFLNLIPVKKLDGGRALYCLLSSLLPVSLSPQKEIFLSVLDFLCSVLLLAFGTYLLLEGGSVTLFILGLWLIWT